MTTLNTKSLLMLLCGLGLCLCADAQTVVAASGGSYEQSSAEVSYTLGEAVIFTAELSGNDVTQGFHQPHLTVVGVEEQVISDVRVYPNPTSGQLIIELGDNPDGMELQLVNALGQVVHTGRLVNQELQTTLDLSDQAAGNYFLKLHNATEEINTYQIIKLN